MQQNHYHYHYRGAKRAIAKHGEMHLPHQNWRHPLPHNPNMVQIRRRSRFIALRVRATPQMAQQLNAIHHEAMDPWQEERQDYTPIWT